MEARYFEDEHSVRDNYFIGIDSEDFHLALKELSSYGYLNTPKSTMDGYPEFILEPSAIAEMQNRYTKNLNKVLKRINELKKLILFSLLPNHLLISLLPLVAIMDRRLLSWFHDYISITVCR